jgi:hypothetical protein
VVDGVLRSRSEMTARDRSNLRFYVLYWLAAMLTRKPAPKASDVAKLDVKAIDEGDVEAAVDEVWKLYEALGSSDQAAKGADLRKRAIEEVTARVRTLHPPGPPCPA